MKVAVITARFNYEITSQLEIGCINRLREKLAHFELFSVPGAVELVYSARKLADSKKFDAIIVIGAVIKGDTDHYEYVCNFVTDGISSLSCTVDIPIVFGVLTTQNEELAKERSDITKMNKGSDFADVAVEMAEFII